FSSRSRHTRFSRDWSSDVCSSDLRRSAGLGPDGARHRAVVDQGRLIASAIEHMAVEAIVRRVAFGPGKPPAVMTGIGIKHLVPRSEERRVGEERQLWWQ